MELLPEGQQNTSEVTLADQKKINKFSTLINQRDELDAQLTKYKTEKEYFDDLGLEIELLDEDEKIQYKVGDAFVFLPVLTAVDKIEKENDELDTRILKLDDEIEAIDDQLAELKKELYAKFGNNINLER